MIKYKVKVPHVFVEFFDVEAEDYESALQIVEKQLLVKDRNPNPRYEQTLPADSWPIITEDEYNKLINSLENQKTDSSKSEIEIAK